MFSTFEYQSRLFKINRETGHTYEFKDSCWVTINHKTEFPNYATLPWVYTQFFTK